MRLRTFGLMLSSVAALALLAACSGGDDEATPTPTAPVAATPVPTATPFSRIPDPLLVSGSGIPGLPGPGSGASEESVEYLVVDGDTIGAIAERFGVDPDVIREANDIEDDQIFVGQTLLIPRGGTVPSGSGDSGSPSTGGTETGGGDTYVVQEGDTAFGIALEFDTTVEALAAANGMTEDEITNLQIGQVINLPTPQ